MRTDDSWPKLILMLVWAMIKVVGMYAGVLFVAAGATVYTLHFIYGTRVMNPRLPESIILGFVIEALCTYGYHSWLGKLIGLRNLVIYSLGIVFPVLLAIALLVALATSRKKFAVRDIAVLIACAAVYYPAYSFLKARKALLIPRVRKV